LTPPPLPCLVRAGSLARARVAAATRRRLMAHALTRGSFAPGARAIKISPIESRRARCVRTYARLDAGVGAFGSKAGMTQVFTADGLCVPVTVIAVREGNVVTQVRIRVMISVMRASSVCLRGCARARVDAGRHEGGARAMGHRWDEVYPCGGARDGARRARERWLRTCGRLCDDARARWARRARAARVGRGARAHGMVTQALGLLEGRETDGW